MLDSGCCGCDQASPSDYLDIDHHTDPAAENDVERPVRRATPPCRLLLEPGAPAASRDHPVSRDVITDQQHKLMRGKGRSWCDDVSTPDDYVERLRRRYYMQQWTSRGRGAPTAGIWPRQYDHREEDLLIQYCQCHGYSCDDDDDDNRLSRFCSMQNGVICPLAVGIHESRDDEDRLSCRRHRTPCCAAVNCRMRDDCRSRPRGVRAADGWTPFTAAAVDDEFGINRGLQSASLIVDCDAADHRQMQRPSSIFACPDASRDSSQWGSYHQRHQQQQHQQDEADTEGACGSPGWKKRLTLSCVLADFAGLLRRMRRLRVARTVGREQETRV